jgi:hypothetical protein
LNSKPNQQPLALTPGKKVMLLQPKEGEKWIGTMPGVKAEGDF